MIEKLTKFFPSEEFMPYWIDPMNVPDNTWREMMKRHVELQSPCLSDNGELDHAGEHFVNEINKLPDEKTGNGNSALNTYP